MVERGGLENRCARERTVGSNPTPYANYFANILILLRNSFTRARDQRFYPRMLPLQVRQSILDMGRRKQGFDSTRGRHNS